MLVNIFYDRKDLLDSVPSEECIDLTITSVFFLVEIMLPSLTLTKVSGGNLDLIKIWVVKRRNYLVLFKIIVMLYRFHSESFLFVYMIMN